MYIINIYIYIYIYVYVYICIYLNIIYIFLFFLFGRKFLNDHYFLVSSSKKILRFQALVS